MPRDLTLPVELLDTNLVYASMWDFLEQPEVSSFSLDPITLHADADGDVAATLVGVIPIASRLVGAYLVPSIASTGVDGSNTSAFVVSIAGTTAISKTNEADTVADTPVAFDAPAVTDVAAGSAVKLANTNGTNADGNAAVVHVALALADANNYPAPGLSVIAPNGGTVTIADGVKGICALAPGATDNDEMYMVASNETIKFVADKVFIAEAEIQFTEASTDAANIMFGMMNAVAADALIDDGGGPRAAGDYVAMWKVDGSTVWRAGVQSNGTQLPTIDVDSEVTAGGASYQRLRIKVVCETTTRAWAEFTVDGVCVALVHFDYASATEMQLVVGVKSGSGNAETLNVDWMQYAVVR